MNSLGAPAGGSVERVRTALVAAGHPDSITEFPAGTRTAADAAAAIGCTVAQIAKSIVFRSGTHAVVVVTSGANRVDPAGRRSSRTGPVAAPYGLKANAFRCSDDQQAILTTGWGYRPNPSPATKFFKYLRGVIGPNRTYCSFGDTAGDTDRKYGRPHVHVPPRRHILGNPKAASCGARRKSVPAMTTWPKVSIF